MRTLAITLGILALILLAVILIAPNVDLDDYCDEPFYRFVVFLLFFVLQLFCILDCFNLPNIDLRTRPPLIPLDLWLRTTEVTTSRLPLLC